MDEPAHNDLLPDDELAEEPKNHPTPMTAAHDGSSDTRDVQHPTLTSNHPTPVTQSPDTGVGTPEQDHTTTTNQGPRDNDNPVTDQDLGLVVVESLPDPLRGQMELRVVTKACQRLANEGWTPRELSEETQHRNWAGAEGGAVVAWLRDLQRPKPGQPSTIQPRRQQCSNGAPIAADGSCCLEHDREEALV